MDKQPQFLTQIDVALVREALASNDDIGVVVRAHIELERAMVRVLEEKLPHYAALKHENFTQHLKALRALGATGRLFQIADQVNKIRNNMAHVKRGLKTKIDENDIREL